MKTTRKRKVIIEEGDNSKKYEYQDTWFTSDDCEEGNRTLFITCFWIVVLIGNIWIISGMIF